MERIFLVTIILSYYYWWSHYRSNKKIYRKPRTKRLITKKKNFVLLSIATVIILTLLSLFIPKSFSENIKFEDINYIYVFDGNNGKEFTINNRNDVEYIVNNIKNNKVKINSLSLGYMGYGLKIKYMDSKGKTLLSFILNSKDTIRKDPFFYKCNDELCFEYIKKIESELVK